MSNMRSEKKQKNPWWRWYLQSNVDKDYPSSALQEGPLWNSPTLVRVKQRQKTNHSLDNSENSSQKTQGYSWSRWVLADNNTFPWNWGSSRRLWETRKGKWNGVIPMFGWGENIRKSKGLLPSCFQQPHQIWRKPSPRLPQWLKSV